MKTLVLANNKGGVGKSSTAVQFAYYAALQLNLRVLVLDMDHQLNSTKSLTLSGLPAVSRTTTTAIFNDGAVLGDEASFLLVPATRELIKLEKQGATAHNGYATNLLKFVRSAADAFDLCVIDTNGNPDIRLTASLICADFVLSPIQLNQEAIDGIGDLLADINIITRLNPKLQLIGILPNMVQASPFQKANFAQIAATHAKLLIAADAEGRDFAHIPIRSVIPEAQAIGQPIWAIKKTAAREAWRDLQPYFRVIADRIGLGA